MDNIRARETPSKPKMLTTMDAVRAGMRGGLRAAGAYDAVHKDECAFSFHTPYSTPAGLLPPLFLQQVQVLLSTWSTARCGAAAVGACRVRCHTGGAPRGAASSTSCFLDWSHWRR
jgi:hypothetical protein